MLKRAFCISISVLVILPFLSFELTKMEKRILERSVRKTWGASAMISHVDQPLTSSHPALDGDFYHILSEKDTLGSAYTGRAYTCDPSGCITRADRKGSDAVMEYFDFCVLLDPSHTILRVEIIDYQSSYGHKICSATWLKQFIGLDGNSRAIPGENVDAVTGATISSHELCLQVEAVLAASQNLRKESMGN